ncbi:hypothetical protein PV328_004911 [Microctonus aethiopoides]|uniref:peptidylglycine monooxygenase n=1 Tax=Microctonus aethiopoides TaxID=144406 RepID=A0AA39KM82_9HYME|nr:hypothetical protein PV328_004911 [Microctonus aethiopoides]
MQDRYSIFLIFIIAVLVTQDVYCHSTETYPILMPNVKPYQSELYLCTPVKINSSNTYYIVGFQPKASMNVAHHIILYGCTTPGAAKSIWNCGEMMSHHSKDYSNNESASPCAEGSEILYAWARDAPDLMLPDNVGFKVGANSPIKYLVLQVHYAHIERFKHGVTDDSGIYLHYTMEPLNKLAGIFLLGTAGSIRSRSIEYMETACELAENKVIHPFAYRVHTHSLGKVVSGYVIKGDRWIELGKRDPLTPQMFYNTSNYVAITKGDILAARCTMNNIHDWRVNIGATNNDEMCNFYLMYYVENDEPLEMKYCFTRGPPNFSWDMANLPNIPHRDASSL